MSNKLFWMIGICGLIFFVSGYELKAEENQAQNEAIIKLMRINGTLDQINTVVNNLVDNTAKVIKVRKPDIEDKALEKFVRSVKGQIAEKAAEENGLLARAVEIFRNKLTPEEVNAILSFYGTPEGRGIIRAMPMIQKDLQAVNENWAKEIAPILIREVTIVLEKDQASGK